MQAERKRIIEEEERAGGRKMREEGGLGDRKSAGSDMVAKEAARLEVMKRRQERELQQLVSYEIMRKQMQVRILQTITEGCVVIFEGCIVVLSTTPFRE